MAENSGGQKAFDDAIDALSELCGIMPEYYDIFGTKHRTSQDTKRSILRAMKLEIDSLDEVNRRISEKRWSVWTRVLEPVKVVSVHENPLMVPLFLPVEEGEEKDLSIAYSVQDEGGRKDGFMLSGERTEVLEEQWIDGRRHVKVALSDTAQRDIGYYTIAVQCSHPKPVFPGSRNSVEKTCRLIITPDQCYFPPVLSDGRVWGISLNLYGIRSHRNWGIGDFGDLREIVKWVGERGGGFVGINPLHTIPNEMPFGVSPYYPVSRLFRNDIYLDLSAIPEVKESEKAREMMMSDAFAKAREEAGESEFVEYEKVASLKRDVIRSAFDHFYENHYGRGTPRDAGFMSYRVREGNSLETFALYQSLRECMKDSWQAHSWQEWPEHYHDPSSPETIQFRKSHEKEVLFYQYVQWLVDEQLGDAALDAEKYGLTVGIYNDLAVGSAGGGSDVWCHQDVFAMDMDVGAPPDDFSIHGQNWGFPPLVPESLRETGYEIFVQTIRRNMRHAGALRIDHALGLFRLFWIPRGMSPRDGAYLEYPSEDLLRIIALESVRNRTVVIAEDLGTIGENVREELRRFRMLSFRLFYFERNYPEPVFSPPDAYPQMAICSVTTHDLPTLYGYWSGRDLDVKRRMGMFSGEAQWQKHVEERERDKRLVVEALRSRELVSADMMSGGKESGIMSPDLCLAVYAYLALAPCKLVLVNLDDILGTLDQQNMPGTIEGHPNWMQKTPFFLEDIVRDGRFHALASMFRRTMGKVS